jgi:hypothetical protein
MYFHGEIYPLKLKMVKNLTVVLRVGGSDGSMFMAKPKCFANLGFASISPDLLKMFQFAQMAKFNICRIPKALHRTRFEGFGSKVLSILG